MNAPMSKKSATNLGTALLTLGAVLILVTVGQLDGVHAALIIVGGNLFAVFVSYMWVVRASRTSRSERRPWQFSIRTLMIVPLVTCVLLGGWLVARSGAINLPEARVRPTAHQTQFMKLQNLEQTDIVEKTASIRGGGAASPAQAVYGVVLMAGIETVLKKFFVKWL